MNTNSTTTLGSARSPACARTGARRRDGPLVAVAGATALVRTRWTRRLGPISRWSSTARSTRTTTRWWHGSARPRATRRTIRW